jgi:hypothetical protein
MYKGVLYPLYQKVGYAVSRTLISHALDLNHAYAYDIAELAETSSLVWRRLKAPFYPLLICSFPVNRSSPNYIALKTMNVIFY